MKKILQLLVIFNIICSSFIPLFAKTDKTEYLLGKENEIVNIDKSVVVEDFNGEPAVIVYGLNGIEVIQNGKVNHLDTLFPVNKLVVIDDINNDGIKDFYAVLKTTDYSDQLFVISGSDGSTISSSRETKTIYNNEVGNQQVSTSVLKLVYSDGLVYMICDYSLICVNPKNHEKVWTYTDKDNIWDFEVNNDKIVLINQLGEVVALDNSTGEELNRIHLANEYEFDLWEDEKMIAHMNLWDIQLIGNYYMITSEDGILYILNTDELEVMDAINMEVVNRDRFEASFRNFIEWDEFSGRQYRRSGILDARFRSIKIVDSNEKYILVSYFMKDKECKNTTSIEFENGFVVIDKTNNEVVGNIPFGKYSTYASALLAVEEGETVIVAAFDSAEGATTFIKFGLNGDILSSKDIITNISSEKGASLTRYNEGYLYEGYESGCVVVNKELNEVSNLFEKVSQELIYSDGEKLVIAEKINNVTTKIIAKDINDFSEIWTYELKTNEKNNGISKIICDDYNNDGITDFVGLVNKLNKENQVEATNFLIVNGKDGSTIVYKKVWLYKAYDEKNKPYDVYLTADEVELVRDLDKDNKKELVVSGQIISSKNFSIKGSISTYIEGEGNSISIGDINKDGFTDVLLLSNAKATIYKSKVSGYNVTYTNSKISIKLNQKAENMFNHYELDDINGDGVKEIIFSDFNSQNYQIYKIYSGADLKLISTLYPEGVPSYVALSVLDHDFNNDGNKEILLMDGIEWGNTIYDVVNNKVLMKYSDYDLDDKYEDVGGQYYHPDWMVIPYEAETSISPIVFSDYDKDGTNDYVITKTGWDEDTKTYGVYLVIYSGKDLKQIDRVMINASNTGTQGLSKVNNSDKYYVLKGYGEIYLINSETMQQEYSYNIEANDFRLINESTVMATNENKVYFLNIGKSFELTGSEVDEENRIHLSWKTQVDFSIASIYDNGTLVGKTTDESYDIRLREGTHNITVALEDAYGKSCSETVVVEISDIGNSYQWTIGVAVVALLLALYGNANRKFRAKKAVKELM